MTKYVMDTYAWIEYFENSEKGKKIASMIESDANEVYTPTTVIAEVISKVLRVGKEQETALEGIDMLSKICVITPGIGMTAGKIHFEEKKRNKNFGMLDAFVIACAKEINAKVITGDEDFRGFKEAILI